MAFSDDPPNDLLTRARCRLRSPSGSGRVLSRQELAEAVNSYLWDTYHITVNLDGTYVGHLEQGRHRWPDTRRREAFRHVLGAHTDAEIGFYIKRGEPAASDSTADPPVASQQFVVETVETSGTGREELLLRAVLLDAGPGYAPSSIVAAADHARRIVDDLLDDGTSRNERIERLEAAVQDHAIDALTVLPHEMVRRLMLDFLEAQHLIRTCRDVVRLRRLWAVLPRWRS